MFHTKKKSLRKTVRVSILAKTSLFRFSYAYVSKLLDVCWLTLVRSFKKCTIPWNCSLDY